MGKYRENKNTKTSMRMIQIHVVTSGRHEMGQNGRFYKANMTSLMLDM